MLALTGCFDHLLANGVRLRNRFHKEEAFGKAPLSGNFIQRARAALAAGSRIALEPIAGKLISIVEYTGGIVACDSRRPDGAK